MAKYVRRNGYDFLKPDSRRRSKIEPRFVTAHDRDNEKVAAEALRVMKGWDTFTQTGNDYDDIDIVFSHEGSPVAYGEVKRRRNPFNKYPDTAIIATKVMKLKRMGESRPAYLIVYFDDMICYCDIKDVDLDQCIVKTMVRRDCGFTEVDKMVYIPNKYLLPIKDLLA